MSNFSLPTCKDGIMKRGAELEMLTNAVLESWGMAYIDLKLFRDIFEDTPFFSAGGWNDTNVWGVLEEGTYDAFAIGRYFLSTPDLVER